MPINLSCDSSFIIPSIMVYESSNMTLTNNSYVETLLKEFLSLCAQALEKEVEIMHSWVSSNKDLNSSYKSHIGEEVEELLSEHFVVNNMFIDDEKVGSLASDAIEFYNITYYDRVSISPLIHSPSMSVTPPLTIPTLLMRSVIPSLFGNVK